jgi:hypothetical protein
MKFLGESSAALIDTLSRGSTKFEETGLLVLIFDLQN